ncbi:MAG TPA: thioredoxin domain-containing protein [Pyrinomonadaceae bacterium]|nr:thioredoxin domain-containing protein [Pyrinomonadaceae bacterium]
MNKETKSLAALAVVVIVGAIIGVVYYQSSVKNERKTTNSAPTNAPTGQLVRSDSPTLGPADAKVTVVEFYDPECEACAAFSPVLKKIVKDYEGKIRLVARFMPLHPSSLPAASFIEAAAEQGKYWQAQELLFQKQDEWGQKHGAPSSEPAPSINALFDKYAKELGLDLNKAGQAIKENRFAEKIARDKKDGQSLGVRQTPTIFVNGRLAPPMDDKGLRALIDEELKK